VARAGRLARVVAVIGRRGFLAAALGALGDIVARRALARGRIPYGTTLGLHVPWPASAIDPHRIDDAMAAFFGAAVFDTLYALDETGAPVPSLASGDPQPEAGGGNGLRVPLRPGLRFASGVPLDARAAAAAIARARSHDAAAWLADVPPPRATEGALVFAARDPRALARALASPLVAIVSPRSTPDRPDGTGPFRAEPGAAGIRFVRNGLAANGPAYLDLVDARRTGDLATPLRAFESGEDDVGWLGSFLHEPRPGARSFDAGDVAWAILRTGRLAGALDAPGVAQAVADGVPHAALAPLVVGPPWTQGAGRWTGAPADLLVRDDAAWLVEVARALSVALSSPSHEVALRPVPAVDLASRRASRGYALMLDVARPAGPEPLGALLGLATADDPVAALALARHPPRVEGIARHLTRAMRVGVVGEVRMQGGRAADVVLPPLPSGRGVDWGSAFRARRG
jgi:peptide/nickel transport system substrate-binding protein